MNAAVAGNMSAAHTPQAVTSQKAAWGVETQRGNRGAHAVNERAVEKGLLPPQDVLKLGAEQHETRHGERVRRDDALDDLHGGVQVAHSVVMATFRKNESITMMKLAREAMESVAQTNFRSTIALPASRPRTG